MKFFFSALTCVVGIFPQILCGIEAEATCYEAKDKSRVVVAGGSLTESIFFLGKEKHIVAVDLTSSYPSAVTKLPSIGYIRNLSIEGVLSLKPTLFVAESSVGPITFVSQIKKTSGDFRVIPEKDSAHGILKKVMCMASVLGIPTKSKLHAENLLREKIKFLAIHQKKNKGNKKRGLIILMMRGPSAIVAGVGTAGDGFLKMLAAENSLSSPGWKPVGVEAILNINPDFLIVTNRTIKPFGNQKQFLSKTGLAMLKASQNGNTYFKDGVAFLGFGPRTLTAATEILDGLNNTIRKKVKGD